MGAPDRFVWWLVQRLALALLLAGLALAGLGLRIFLRDRAGFDLHRQELVRALTAETGKLKAALDDTGQRMAGIRVEIAAQTERAEQAAKVARQLDELSSGLNRLTTGSAQLQENREGQARMQLMETGARKHTTELEQTLLRTQWEKDGLEITLARKQQELSAALADDSLSLHCARGTWDAYGRWVLAAVAVGTLGPVFWRRSARRS